MHSTPGNSDIVWAELASGERLPVIDVTNPAFRLDAGDADLVAWRAQIAQSPPPATARTGLAQHSFARAAPVNSLLGRMFLDEKGFLDGSATYLLKTGAENLPPTATEFERRMLSSPNAMSLRLRLQQVAHLIADRLKGSCEAASLQLAAVGGGTAIEALNALIVLRACMQPTPLPPVIISLLDIEDDGLELAQAALRALQAPDGPLFEVSVTLAYFQYSWNAPQSAQSVLDRLAQKGAAGMLSSEGALFEYAADDVIIANLSAWRHAGPIPVVGSVIRADAAGRAMVKRSPYTLYARGIEGIEQLASTAGYRVAEVCRGVASDGALAARPLM